MVAMGHEGGGPSTSSLLVGLVAGCALSLLGSKSVQALALEGAQQFFTLGLITGILLTGLVNMVTAQLASPKLPLAVTQERAGDKVPGSPGTTDTATVIEQKGDEPRKRAVVVVDPFSTGAVLARLALERGYEVIRVISTAFPDDILSLLPASCADLRFAATIQHDGDADETVKKIRELDMEVVGFTIGCESGVEVYDQVATRYGGMPTNGEELSECRRDKYLMGEKVRQAGLRAVKQVETDKWEEVEEFVKDLYKGRSMDNIQIVIKPVRSAGTENVFFVDNMKKARQCFNRILGHQNFFGEINDTVLVQEFLDGKEYVVDTVSYHGVHKVVAIWSYDKRPCNDARFVYFGVEMFESEDGVKEAKMAAYIKGVLDALGVKHGPAHSEVMWLEHESGPCLVEVGCRPHGGEGTFTELSTPCIGYNQLSVILDTITHGEKYFSQLPDRPERLKAHAKEVTFVSKESGILVSYQGLDKIEALPSFRSMELKVNPGDRICKTTDFLTTPGSVMLVHESAEVLARDVLFVEELQETELYEVNHMRRLSF